MAFIYYRKVRKNGKTYTYPEVRESRRMPGKKNPVSVTLGRIGGSARKAADERYRGVLRENVSIYGTSRPGSRYAREAAAREEYHRHLDAVSRGETGVPLSEQESHKQRTEQHWQDLQRGSPFDARAGRYAASHPSAKYRAQQEYADLRARAQAEDKPTVPPAPNYEVDDEIEAREAVKEAAIDEYTSAANAADAAADGSMGEDG